MNETEKQRLAHALNELRPDWPISSLTTFIAKHFARKPYRDAAVALVWVAVDSKPDGTPASETPKRVLEAGPWHRAVLIDSPGARTAVPPKREESCLTCGRHLNACICGEARVKPEEPASDAPRRVDELRVLAGLPPKHQEETQ